MIDSKRQYWNGVAKNPQGAPLPPPIRPPQSDIARFEACVHEVAESIRQPRFDALLLGVTAGIATLGWPDATSLVAIDSSEGMIRYRWPSEGRPSCSAAIQGDWRRMPLPDTSRDIALGDGCYMSVDSFQDCEALNEEVFRVLRTNGRFCMRIFVRPEIPQPAEELFAALFDGRIANFEVFRWRLAMSLHGADRVGVRADDVWQLWQARVPDSRMLLERLGWQAQSVRTMERWKGVGARFPMPTLAEAREMLAHRFDILHCSVPDYELGDCCPMLVMRPRR